MADYVVRRIPAHSDARFGIFHVGGDRRLFDQDFDTAKDAFAFLRTHYNPRKVSVSKVHSNWLVFIT